MRVETALRETIMKPAVAKPLWRLEDLLVLCFQPDELRRSLSRSFPLLAA